MKASLLKRAILVEGDKPPSEFRIFRKGKNSSTKGTVVFDEVSAESVMAKWADYGNELAVDYAHAMLDPFPMDPALAGKAAGWFGLEVRDGELWAVNVRWTEPAAEALSRKEWRYMSPAFYTDEEERVTEMLNVALTNVPATKKLEPLMAADRRVRDHRQRSAGPSLYEVQRAIDAALQDLYPRQSETAPRPWVCDLFTETAVFEYDGRTFEIPYQFDGRAAQLGKAVEVRREYKALARRRAKGPTMSKSSKSKKLALTPENAKKAIDAISNDDGDAALEILKSELTGGGSGDDEGGGGEGEGGAAPAFADPGDDETTELSDEDSAETAAALGRLVRLSGKNTWVGILEEVGRWRESHLKLEAGEKKLARDRAVLEAKERRQLYSTLISTAKRRPASVWANPTAEAKDLKAKPYLERMTIEELRQHVADEVGTVPPKQRDRDPEPPTTDADHGLTEEQLALCHAKKLDPAKFAATKNAIRARSNARPPAS